MHKTTSEHLVFLSFSVHEFRFKTFFCPVLKEYFNTVIQVVKFGPTNLNKEKKASRSDWIDEIQKPNSRWKIQPWMSELAGVNNE